MSAGAPRRSAGVARGLASLALVVLATAGCAGGDGAASDAPAGTARADEVQAALDGGLERIFARADSMDEVLRPLPLLTSAEEAGLRRYLNAQQLERARTLGVARPSTDDLPALRRDGRLIPLEDSTSYWVMADLDSSVGLLTPDARDLLSEIGRRFQERLAGMGLPPLRLVVSSILRTAEDQAELRRTNPNAAAGVSTHEYGTTLDVLYSRFAAPESLDDWVDAGGVRWLAPRLQRVAAMAVEGVAAHRSREIKKVLGEVLLEMQREGKVMVTLERQQPVFHMTVAREY